GIRDFHVTGVQTCALPISKYVSEDYQGQAPRNVQDLLRSNAPGLNIGIATDAKAEASLTIRGKGTLTASDSPLIVLDNVIYQGALADINPADILTDRKSVV